MRVIEIRDLDGPNLFLAAPAVKLELEIGPEDVAPEAIGRLMARLEPLGVADGEPGEGADAIGALLADAVVALHGRAGGGSPVVVWEDLETPGRHALAWAWEHRRFAMEVADLLCDAAVGTADAAALHDGADRLAALLATTHPDDAPLVIRDADRHVPAIGVTGTNGKTTSTRLIAHILQGAGFHPGWTTTAGVVIDGETVLEGDYSGPSGARRVLEDPRVDVAVLETARGGILLRGIAVESVDVSVFTNVSPDHLGLHGVHTVEGLARVKQTVVRITRPEGWAVLNADDPLVRGAASCTRAGRFWTTQDPGNPTVLADLAEGGRALIARDGVIVECHGGEERALVGLAELPFAFGGRAKHMVENGLNAAAACLALGIDRDVVAAGLRSFGTDPAHNPGRNDVYTVNGGTVIVDYAHNEAGVAHLYELARGMAGPGGTVTAVVGSAGDRSDAIIRELGRLAAAMCDRVILKGTQRYLRGRGSNAEIDALFLEGFRLAGKEPDAVVDTEAEGVSLAMDRIRPGDVVAVMCFEDPPATRALVAARADG